MKPSSAHEATFVTAAAILFGLAFSYPILQRLSYTGAFYDWDLEMNLHWVAVDTVTRFHQLPLWNPYKCGGMPMLANPQSRIASPFFVLSLLFGPFLAFNLEIPIRLSIGWSGGYVLARVLGLSPLAGVVCGSIFVGSSWFGLHEGVGHANFLPFVYMPWITAFLWMSFTRGRLFPAAMGAALLALMLGEGNVYGVSYVVLLASLLGLTLAAIDRRWSPIAMLTVFALFSIGFAAIKLFPTLRLMLSHPRPWNNLDASPLWLILYAIFSRNQELNRPAPGKWEFFEYGAYIGPIAALLAVGGVVSSVRRAAPWLIAGALFFTLAMGEAGAYYPWTILHHLPVFSSERAAPRFLIPFVLMIGVLAAFGADFIQQRFRPWGSIGVYLLTAMMLIDFWIVCVPNLAHAVIVKVTPVTREPMFRQNLNQTVLLTLPTTRANEGAINCYEYVDFPSKVAGFNGPGYRGEQYLLGPGTVRLSRWTPNVLDYEVATASANTLVVNQNYFPGWRLVDGYGEVFANNGLLAVHVPAGNQHIELRYRGDAFFFGTIISVLTALAALALRRFETRR